MNEEIQVVMVVIIVVVVRVRNNEYNIHFTPHSMSKKKKKYTEIRHMRCVHILSIDAD